MPNGQKRQTDVIESIVCVDEITTGGVEDTRNVSQNRRKGGVVNTKAPLKKLDANRRSEIITRAATKQRNKGEKEMTINHSASLHDLLSEGGKELQNIKFLAGSKPTEQGMCAEATRVIKSAMKRGMPHNPPVTGVEKSTL